MSRKLTIFGAAKLFFLALVVGFQAQAQTDPRAYAVEVSATVQSSPAQINLIWSADANATSYTLSRKAQTGTAWSTIATLAAGASSYSDTAVSANSSYEYQIKKTTTVGYTGYGYILAGINAPLVEGRGKIVLIVDNTYATDLAAELSRLQSDLTGDGWTVLRHDVSRTETVPNVKALIKADYNADPTNVKAVFLFGHVPVPYSGSFGPDGHPDHQGAWPADVYYGDMDGAWTDSSVNVTSAALSRNWNVPGDGKFDQSDLPSDVELAVGRVDLSLMTCFSNKTPSRSEKDLLRQYLNKDHNFRHGLLNVARRGVVADNFGEFSGQAFAASGWRNFAPMFGANNNTAVGANYFPTVAGQSYLWSYACGGGSFYTCGGVGSSDDFANIDIQSVFTMFFGSYFGDWDSESDFLRAPLGSTSYALVSLWAGRPHWFVHQMALGETIGSSTRLSQNNNGLYLAQNPGTRQVHVSLMGDPSLRMHPVVPPSNLSGAVTSTTVTLSWAPSTDSNVQGYHVYRATSANGPFTRITGTSPITGTTFVDTITGDHTYMVRAVKLETSSSGTYFNPSQGIFFSTGNSANSIPAPSAPTTVVANAASSSQIDLAWVDTASNEDGFKVERKTGTAGAYAQIATVGANVVSYSDTGLSSGTQYYYRIRSYNVTGDSAYSSEASATTGANVASTASATLLSTDATTQGSWKNVYGTDGYTIVGNATVNPAYATVSASGNSSWVWNDPSSSTPALQKSGTTTDRIAAAWYASTSFTVNVNLTDGRSHRVAFYFLDWDASGRAETVEISDASSGAILNSQSVSGFSGGKYLVFDLKGNVNVKFTRTAGPNAALSGIFFSTSSVQLNNQTPNTLGTYSAANGTFQFRINGAVGQQFIIEASTNLVNWTPVATNTLTGTTFDYSDPNSASLKSRFYRSRLSP